MSVDLRIEVARPIQVAELVNEMRNVLATLLRFDSCPPVVLSRIVGGKVLAVSEEQLADDSLYAASYDDAEDQVLLTTVTSDEDGTKSLTVSVGRTREPTEYALGLAVALAIGGNADSDIEDGYRFWTSNPILKASALMESVRVPIRQDTFGAACLALVGARLN